MNVDLNLLKESISEYCEEIYAMSINYMKNNNIDFHLTGEDLLTIKLRNLEILKDKVISSDNYDIVISYKKEVEELAKEIRGIIWN